MKNVRAAYMHWAKQHPRVTFDLCGSNLLGCSAEDLPEAATALEINGPNDEGYPPLIEAIARRYGVTVDQVATGTGTSGANFLVYAALLDAGDDVLVEKPGYDPLFACAELLGARVIHFDRRFEDGYGLDPDQVQRALTPRTRLIVLSSLHNPSGVLASPAAIREVGHVAEKAGAHVLVDEVYLDSAVGEPRTTAATLGDVFISTSSLTKSYGLSGLRCGWALAAPAVAERIRRARDIVDGVGAFPADRIAVVAFEHLDRLAARARRILEPNFTIVRQFLDTRSDLQYVAPAGGTVVFPRLRDGADAGPFIDRLLRDEQVAVVPGRFFQSPAHFRLAFGLVSPDTLRGGLDRIRALLDKWRS